MTQYFRDFSEYSTGAIGTVATADWAVQQAGGGDWTQTINTDAGATGGQTAVFARTATGNAVNLVAFTHISTTGDFECLARIKLGTTADANVPFGPAIINTADNQAYAWRSDAANSWRLARFSTAGGVGTNIGSSVAFTTPAADTYFWMKIGRRDTATSAVIYGSLWADGGSDPGELASGGNTTITTARPGMYAFRFADAPFTFDVFGAADGGDSAPTTDPGGGGGGNARKRPGIRVGGMMGNGTLRAA